MKDPASLSHQQYIAGQGSQAYLNSVDTHSNTVGGSVHVDHLVTVFLSFNLPISISPIQVGRHTEAAALDHLSIQHED